jgi:excinuclease UvrABC nuclease subunit
MPEKQEHLFDPPKPLLERFGADFFRHVPARPGVYIMGGEAERVLYIGQSRNLRARLGSYKNARPDRAPRKIIRLIHAVRSIVWEECGTPEAAQLKENELLRTHRPKFNVQNTWPRAYRFIALQPSRDGFSLELATRSDCPGKVFGAFKGCTTAYGALLRLLWTAIHQPASPNDYPLRMLDARPLPKMDFRDRDSSSANRWIQPLESFLTGESDELARLLSAAIPSSETVSVFQRNLQEGDLQLLGTFFLRGPGWIRTLRRRHEVPDPIIPQEELDDWLVLEERPRLNPETPA